MAYEDLDDYSVGAAGSDTFDVVIPDLDPSTAYPIQFRWQFADKTVGEWSVSKILNTPEIARPEATNIVAVWEGTSLKVTWDSQPLATAFQIYLTAGSTTMSWSVAIDKSKTQQTFVLSKQDNMANFGGVFKTTLSGVLKTTYIDNTTSGSAFAIAPYSDTLCGSTISDTDWTLTPIANGFTIAWTANATLYPTYDYTEVYISDSSGGTYTKEYSGLGPATIKVSTLSANYVKIRHASQADCFSSYSNVRTVSAYDPVSYDDTPPTNTFTLGTATVSDDSNGLFTFDKKVLFTWTENADTDTAGYRIRFRIAGSTGPYTYMSVPGKAKTSTYLYGLKGGQTYEIAVSTFDIYGNTNETEWQTYSNIVVPVSTSLVADVAITAGDMKLGYGIGGSNSQKGLYIAPDNYWYVQGNTNESSAARLSVGGTSDKLVWDGANLTVTGTVYANAGRFTGAIDVGSSSVNGQLRVYAGGNKFEVGRLTDTSGSYINEFGIQGTNSSGKLFQLDTINGIITNAGTIGGWTINSTSIYKNQTSLNSDGSITAGSGGEFQVTTAGALTATSATIQGVIRASSGGFGTYSGSTLSKGWTISSASIVSTATGTDQITLNGETGVISGGTISGTKVVGSQITVTGTVASGGVTGVNDSAIDGGSDQNDGGTLTSSGGGNVTPTITMAGGEISSNNYLLMKGSSYTEIWAGGSKSAAFSASSSSLNFTNGLYLGSQGSSAIVQAHTGPYITVDARMRLRYGAPLTYPNGSSGAYIRNIYIKQTTNNPASTTGNVGDIFMTY